MSRKSARLPEGSKKKITILCTKEQEQHIRDCGCIACDDDVCDCTYCDRCAYSPDNIEFKRKEYIEYAVEVYDKNERFVRQIDVFDTEEKAEEFINKYDEELLDGEHLGIFTITYDENEVEIGVERL